MNRNTLTILSELLLLVGSCNRNSSSIEIEHSYPAVWFAPINDPNKPDWEILPQEAMAGGVILSKRNELGIFAATPSDVGTASEINSTSNGEAKLHRK